MNKRTLPPFGRQLLFQRQRGVHPIRVWVLYGDDCWQRKPTDAPVLCVPGDYAPGRYDWSLLAGVPADIVWRGGEWIHVLAAEVALFAAPTRIRWRGPGLFTGEAASHCETVDAFLILERRRPEVVPRWTPEIESDYRERELAWTTAAVDDRLSHGRQRHTA